MKKTNRFVIWDFDGTLAQRIGGWSGALLAVLKKKDPSTTVTVEQLRPYLQAGFPWHAPEIGHSGLSPADWWAEMLPVFGRAFRSVGVEAAAARDLARQVRAAYLDLRAWRRFDDATSTLQSLSQQGWRHVLLSNHVPELPRLLDHLELSAHFAAVFNSAQTGWEKPNGHAFRLAADWIRAQGKSAAPVQVWMVGDSLSSDIRGAQEAGLPAILVHASAPGVPCSETLAGLLKILV